MGANIRTFAVRRNETAEVRQTLTDWLIAKGFEPSDSPRLFAAGPQRERSLLLSINDDWTIVAYSHAMQEGDRLVFRSLPLRDFDVAE